MNTVVRKGREGSVVGAHGLGKKNERGRMFIGFCSRKKLCIMNTRFKIPERRKYTWKATVECNGYQLDYTVVSERYKNIVKDAHAYPGAIINSDHNLVMMKVRLHMKRPRRGKQKVMWKRELLKNKDVESDFNDAILKVMKSENCDIIGIETNWQKIKRKYRLLYGAKKVIGVKEKKREKNPGQRKS